MNVAPPAPAADAQILVVDDEPRQRRSLREVLQLAGCRVAEATDGEAALIHLRRAHHAVVVLDWGVPGCDRRDLLDRILRLRPRCAVIVVCGYPLPESEAQFLRRTAKAVLGKPYDVAGLLALVRRILAGSEADTGARAPLAGPQRLRLQSWALEDGPDLLGVVDPAGRLIYANRPLRTLLRLGRSESLEVGLGELLRAEDWNLLHTSLSQVIRSAQGWQQQVQRLRPRDADVGDARRYDLRLRQIPWPDGVGGTLAAAVISAREAAAWTPAPAPAHGFQDLLTGLPNRALLNDRLRHALRQAQRNRERLALMFVDLDRFKRVNDELGHRVGDSLLRAASGRLRQLVRESDTLARYGGDEFILLVDPAPDTADIDLIAQKILASLRQPFMVQGHELHLSASIGIALYPDHADRAEGLIECADLAMYEAKQAGKSGYRHYAAEVRRQFELRSAARESIAAALARGEFVLHYLPQFKIDDQSINSVEALLRWNHPDKGMLPAAEFIERADSLGLTDRLGDWVLRTVFSHQRIWRGQGAGPMRVTVNLSASQLGRPDFVARLLGMMAEFQVRGESLVLDIPEAALGSGDLPRVQATLNALAVHGIGLAVDDFGTGYSPLGLLNALPIDTIKLDGSLIDGPGSASGGRQLVKATGALAKGLGLRFAAEGVESREQLQRLSEAGAELAQGFYFSVALPFEEAGALLRAAAH